jgi:hypothetical protein
MSSFKGQKIIMETLMFLLKTFYAEFLGNLKLVICFFITFGVIAEH